MIGFTLKDFEKERRKTLEVPFNCCAVCGYEGNHKMCEKELILIFNNAPDKRKTT